ncbi:unnamed protein product [Prunus armeniaca]|uniref:Uncharacterized protein n=1 Tax=Prunus armeniaca TaxID=36596 RepID=A0A6J5XIK1_PRUAR|nr:unnamed protein product [Prunus armeniaca]
MTPVARDEDHALEPVAVLTEEDFPHVMNSSGAPALVVNTILPKHQLEVGESSSLVPNEIIINPSAKDGKSLAMVPHEGASPQFLNHV